MRTNEKLAKRRVFVRWMQIYVPPDWWESIWWVAPAATLALLPLGFSVLALLELLGWSGAGRAGQGLILLALSAGFVVGITTLWSIDEAGLKPDKRARAEWLARFAIVGPFLFVLALFWLSRFV
jgi:hypothetical protein